MVHRTTRPGLPLGLAQLAVTARAPLTLPLDPDDQILFYTDGITEARDSSGGLYPLERCPALLTGQDPGAALEHLHDDVIRHVGHALLDDAALLLIRRHPSSPPPKGPDGSAATPQNQPARALQEGDSAPAG